MTYYSTRNIKQGKGRTMRAYLTQAQKVEVLDNLSDGALVLLEFYLSKTHITEYSYLDEKVADALHWNESKVKRLRLALTKFNCFDQVIITGVDNKSIITTIGKRWI